MTERKQELTAERLRELLAYDQDTGVFTWKVNVSNVKAGGVAGGHNTKGYTHIKIDGRKHSAHRLVWLYAHGEWPPAEVDHINGIKADNRIVNLREATRSENAHNLRKSHADSKTGFLGVAPSYGKFKAHIMVDGKKKHLGYFPTPEEAHAAYLAAKRQLHSHNTL